MNQNKRSVNYVSVTSVKRVFLEENEVNQSRKID